MRKILALLLVVLMLTGCASKKDTTKKEEETTSDKLEQIVIETNPVEEEEVVEEVIPEPEKLLDVSTLGTTGKDVIFAGIDEAKAKEIDAILDGFGKNISLAVASKDGEKFILYNTEQQYFSACTIKIPWILYLCKGIDSGKYSKDTVLTYQQKHYHDGSGIIRKGNYGDTYTVEKLIHLCLSISDNVAYEMLVDMIDRNDFDQFTRDLGYQSFQLKSWSIWSSNSVVKDYVGIWNETYKYFETGTPGAVMMKNGCTNTYFAYGVETLKDSDYSHKSGDNFGSNCAYNDAGIVWAETPYMYAVFSKCEGTSQDIKNVNAVMTIVHELFGGNITN